MSVGTLSNEELDEMRQKGDNHADSFITGTMDKHELPQINTFFKKIIYNNQLHSEGVPSDFSDYVKNNSDLPKWADISKIELAQKTFTRIGPAFVIAYFCKSLPECYACGKGAEILFKTGRLSQHTRRRIAQTAQFVLDVMSPGGLESGGRGIATALKVRLMHASIRYYFMKEVNKGSIDYNVSENGYPINQEDLLGTMLAFSCVVIEGMEKLGYSFTIEEKESIIHLWNCVGFLIGINEEQMPRSFDHGIQIWNSITDRHFEKTDAGVELSNLLVNFLDEILKERVFYDVVTILMHRLLEQKAAVLLNIKSPKFYNPLALVTFVLGILLLKLESKGIFSKIASHYVNLKLLRGLEKYIAEGEETAIYIPPSLRSDWQLDNPLSSIFSIRSK